MKLDLHVHTTASPDGITTPRQAVRAAIRRGLDGIAVTDHNTNAAVAAVRAAAPDGFIVIAGAEYSTDCGHVLALFCEELASGLTRDGQGCVRLTELAVFVRERRGLLVAAHPYSGRRKLPDALIELSDGLESLNARELSRDPGSRERVEALALKSGLFITGGSDAHVSMEIGRAYTEFPSSVEFPDSADLRESLKSGLCTARGRPGRAAYRLVSRYGKRLRRLFGRLSRQKT